MKKKISRIISVNLLPPLLSLGLLSAYALLFFVPEMERLSGEGVGTEQFFKTLMPYTVGVLFVTVIVFVFSAVQNLRTELSRERIKKSYDIIDEEYQNWIETTADGFIYISDKGNITADNIICGMLEYTVSEISSLKPERFVNNDIGGLELMKYLGRPDDEITGRYETKLIKKDGESIDVLISASRIDSSDMNGNILIIKDMSNKARTTALRMGAERKTSITELQSALQYIYQNAGSMMVDPLLVYEEEKICSAVDIMNNEHKNTFIVTDADGYAVGIVTDQDLRQRVISGEIDTDSPVKQIMSAPVVTAEPNIMFFEAFRMMRDNSIRQLVINDGENKPAGILTEKKLLQIQSSNSAILFEELKKADTVDQFRDCYRLLTFSVKTLVMSGAKAVNISGVVSRTAETITQKLIEMSFLRFGPPPCDFAYIVMGSEGRGEQTLLTDQDNGIIFSDVDADKLERFRGYFLKIGAWISYSLNYIGYSYCNGGVMASKPKWVRSESEWSNQFYNWVSGESSGNMLDMNIIFDFKCVYGDLRLSKNLRKGLWEVITRYPGFLREMAATVSEFKPPLTMFGKIQVKRTEHDDEVFDIKKALGPLILYARTMALRERVDEISTTDRLRALRDKEVITGAQYRNYHHAFEYLTLLRFHAQVKALDDGETLDNLIYIEDLMDVELLSLRKIFKQISAAQDALRLSFTGRMR